MNSFFRLYGIKTPLLTKGSQISLILADSIRSSEAKTLEQGDIIVIAESPLATVEGNIIELDKVIPSREACIIAKQYKIEPEFAQVVLNESDSVIGGIPGFILSLKNGTLLPNAGVDHSNAPPGSVVLLPADPDKSAERIANELEKIFKVQIAVIVGDSRTHPLRVGSAGVAIGCYGIDSVIDDRGNFDLFNRELLVTKRAIADNIVSAAEIVMGEAAESTPVALIRGLGLPLTRSSGIETILPSECLFIGTFRPDL